MIKNRGEIKLLNLNPLQNRYTTFAYFLLVKILDYKSTIFAVKPTGWENELNIIVRYTKDFINPELIMALLVLVVPISAFKLRKKFSTVIESMAVVFPFIIVGNYLLGMGYYLGLFVTIFGFALGIFVVTYSLQNGGFLIPNDENWLLEYEKYFEYDYWFGG